MKTSEERILYINLKKEFFDRIKVVKRTGNRESIKNTGLNV
jgi:hypothetical protein